jgi:hypothetical protein
MYIYEQLSNSTALRAQEEALRGEINREVYRRLLRRRHRFDGLYVLALPSDQRPWRTATIPSQ